MLKGYKIHEEQIAKIARDLKERCHTRRPDSRLHGCSRKRNEHHKNGKTGSATRVQVKKTVWETGPMKRSVMEGQKELFPKMGTPGLAIMAIRCFRCGVDFPVADFFYTQKSGLCIDCWEAMVL